MSIGSEQREILELREKLALGLSLINDERVKIDKEREELKIREWLLDVLKDLVNAYCIYPKKSKLDNNHRKRSWCKTLFEKTFKGDDWEKKLLGKLRPDLLIIFCLVISAKKFREIYDNGCEDTFAETVNQFFNKHFPEIVISVWSAKWFQPKIIGNSEEARNLRRDLKADYPAKPTTTTNPKNQENRKFSEECPNDEENQGQERSHYQEYQEYLYQETEPGPEIPAASSTQAIPTVQSKKQEFESGINQCKEMRLPAADSSQKNLQERIILPDHPHSTVPTITTGSQLKQPSGSLKRYADEGIKRHGKKLMHTQLVAVDSAWDKSTMIEGQTFNIGDGYSGISILELGQGMPTYIPGWEHWEMLEM